MKKKRPTKAGRRGFLMPTRGPALSEHQDPRSEEYRVHQPAQREKRAEDLQAFREKMAAKRDAIDDAKAAQDAKRARKQEVEAFDIDFVLSASGAEISIEEHRLRRKILNETRKEYLSGGRWRKLRGYEYRLVHKGKVLRISPQPSELRKSDPSGAKWDKKELPSEKVPAIFYEAFSTAPFHSLGFLNACKGGLRENVSRVLKEVARDMVPILARTVRCEVVAVPFHAKDKGGHFQPSFVFVDSEGKKLGRRNSRHLGRALLGAYRIREFYISRGLSGVELEKAMDETTGCPGACAGLDLRLAERGDVAVDLQMAKWLDEHIESLLERPEFSALKPFFEAAKDDYAAMKADDRRAVTEAIQEEDDIEAWEQGAETAHAWRQAQEAEARAKEMLEDAKRSRQTAFEFEQAASIKAAQLDEEAAVLKEEWKRLALERENIAGEQEFLQKEKQILSNEKTEQEARLQVAALAKADLADALRLVSHLRSIHKVVGQIYYTKGSVPGVLMGAEAAPDSRIFSLTPRGKELIELISTTSEGNVRETCQAIIAQNSKAEADIVSYARSLKSVLSIKIEGRLSDSERDKLNRCYAIVDVAKMNAVYDRILLGRAEPGDYAWLSAPTLKRFDELAVRFSGLFEGTFLAAWSARLRSLRKNIEHEILREADASDGITLQAGLAGFNPGTPDQISKE